ncbi:MAG: BBP7 family outer membrane beta-barrel protein [Pirellulales bacterium]
MRRTATLIAVLAVAGLGWWTRAAADDPEPCPCGDSYASGSYSGGSNTGGDDFWTSARRARWQHGPDGCPQPAINYFDPHGRWYVAADGIALKRDPSDERPIATRDTATDVVLSTSDLRGEFEGGLRLLVGRQLSERWAIEGSYFGLTTWRAQAAVRDSTLNADGTLGNLFSPFSGFGDPAVVGLDFNSLASINNTSSLDNFELNVRQRVDLPASQLGAYMLYGVRFMNLRERFEYRTESASPAPGGSINAIAVETDNDAVGFQLGSALEWRVEERGWITVEMKGVVAHNNADQATVGDLSGIAAVAGARGESRTTFVGDLSVAAMYQFTPRLLGRIGYQSIWVDGVALASENLEADPNVLTLGPPRLVHDGSVVYHGPFAGLTLTW